LRLPSAEGRRPGPTLAVVAVVFVAAVVSPSATSWPGLLRDARLPVLVLAVLASYVQAGLSSALWRSALTSFGEPVRPARVARGDLRQPAGALPARQRLVRRQPRRPAVAGGARRSTLAAVAALETVLVPGGGLRARRVCCWP
jgi:hypothetical protein